MKHVFETTTYSELVSGHPEVVKIIKEAEKILIPSFTVAELRYGFRLGNRQEENDKLLNRFIANKKVQVLLPDNATADYFVNIAVYARKKGVQLSTHDIWIAALSEQWDATLVSFDRDFKYLGYKELKLIFFEK
jgi:tRNA(fMet)-specific endonuclease VapC